MHIHPTFIPNRAVVTGLACLLASPSCGRIGFEHGNSVVGEADGGSDTDGAADTPDAGPLVFTVLGQAGFAVDTGTISAARTVMDLAVDPDGNIYVTGGFASANFGGGTHNADGTNDAYIASFDAQMGERWLQDFGGAALSNGLRLFWHNASLYSFITYQGPLDDAGIVAQNQGRNDHLIVRMSANAQVEDWAVFGSTGNDDGGRALYVTEDGQVLTGGACANAFDYGGGALVGDGSRDACIALLDGNLDHVRSDRLLGPSRDTTRALGVFPNGDAMIAGEFTDTITIDGQELVSAGGKDVFVMRVSPDGSVIWKDSFGGPDDDFPEHAVVDSQGYIYTAVNTLSASWQYGGITMDFDTADGPDSVLIASDGWMAPHWAAVFTGPGREVVEDIAVLDNGNIAFAGGFTGPAKFAGETVEAAGGDQDLLVGAVNPWGELVWWRAFGTPGTDLLTAVDGHPAGGVVVAGYASGPVDFGAGPVGANNPTERGIVAYVTFQ